MNLTKKKKLIYIGFAFKHHKDTHAGYHQIKNYLKYDRIIDCTAEHEFKSYKKTSFFSEAIRKITNRLTGQGTTLAILYCIYLSIFYRNQVFHFIYPENSYKWLHSFKGKTNKIVGTFHQPIEYFEKNDFWKKNIKHFDSIILMTQKDVSKFNNLRGENKSVFIPHGIATEFYKPNPAIKKRNMILMVGSWLRDFKFANKVFQMIIEKDETIIIKVVTQKDNWKYFNNTKINLLTNITDIELRDLYLESKCMFLPLKSFTANNAILEAASTGSRIVVASDEIDVSYFNDNEIDFLPLNIEETVNYLLSLPERTNANYIIASKVKNTLSWQIIAKETELHLQTIL